MRMEQEISYKNNAGFQYNWGVDHPMDGHYIYRGSHLCDSLTVMINQGFEWSFPGHQKKENMRENGAASKIES